MKSKSYPILDVLSTAVAAYIHNQNKIVRVTLHDQGSRIDSNRQLISDQFESNIKSLTVTANHREQAVDIIQYLQQTLIMQNLKDSPDRFLSQVNQLLSSPTVTSKDFGILAWAPKLAEDYQRKDRVREISAHYENHSRYVGHPRDKITTDFTLIQKRYVKSIDCWAVYGYDANDNLLFYWAKDLDKVCEVGKISARIKDHKQDQYCNGALVTVLNYVKVI